MQSKEKSNLKNDKKTKTSSLLISNTEDIFNALSTNDQISQRLQMEIDTEKMLEMDLINIIRDFVHDNLPFTQGAEGEIYKVPVERDGKVRYFLVAKKRFDTHTQFEFQTHEFVHSLLKEKSITQYIDVPDLYFRDEEEGLIIMEYIQGKTLYAKVIEKILYEKFGVNIECESDTDAEYQLRKKLKNNSVDEITQDYMLDFISEQAKYIKLFTQDEGSFLQEKTKEFIDLLHKNGVYHRDIGDWRNLRNVMIGDDGKLYVIDFGRSFIGELGLHSDEDEIYGGTIDGKLKQKYANDKNLITILNSMTMTQEDEEFNKEKQAHRKHIESIKQDSSVLDVLVANNTLGQFLDSFNISNKNFQEYCVSIQENFSSEDKLKRLNYFDFDKKISKKKLFAILLLQSQSNINDFLSYIQSYKNQNFEEWQTISDQIRKDEMFLTSGVIIYQGKELNLTSEMKKNLELSVKIAKKKLNKLLKKEDYILFIKEIVQSFEDFL